MTSQDTEAGEAPGDHRLFLAVVISAVLVSVITGNMVNVLLPTMRESFGVSPAQIGWVITAYSLVYAIGIPLYGRISDVIGIRRIYVVGLSGFVLGCGIAAVAPTLPVLILGRVVQAAGGAAVAALAVVGVSKVIPEDRRGAALGLVASSVGLGSVVGPVVGAAVGEIFGWRGLFALPVIPMLILIPIAQRALPVGETVTERRFDIPGGVLLGLVAGTFLFGITSGQTDGFGSALSWGSFLVAAAAAVAFVWRINSAEHPFVPPDLLRDAAYLRIVGIGFLTTFGYVTAVVLSPLMLVEMNGSTTREAGLVLTPGAVAVVLVARLSGKLSDRVGSRALVLAGLAALTGSVLLVATFLAGASAWLVAIGVVGFGVGSSLIISPLNNAAAKVLPKESIGVGMGIHNGASFFGGGVGVALIGAFLAARQGRGSQALNPLYQLDAPAYSDAFLAVGLVLIVALVLASSMPRRAQVPETTVEAPHATRRLEAQRT